MTLQENTTPILSENTTPALSESQTQPLATNVTPSQSNDHPFTDHPYAFLESDLLASPSLVFYKDLIRQNTARIIEMAGSPDRLWPHVKTHKSADLVALQLSMGH